MIFRICMQRLGYPIRIFEKIGMTGTTMIAKNARVVLERNLWKKSGLTNGSFGVVVDIVEGLPNPIHPKLPNFVLVKFDNYIGPTWKDSGAVPVTPIKDEVQENGRNYKCTRIPLRAAYAGKILSIIDLEEIVPKYQNQIDHFSFFI